MESSPIKNVGIEGPSVTSLESRKIFRISTGAELIFQRSLTKCAFFVVLSGTKGFFTQKFSGERRSCSKRASNQQWDGMELNGA